MDGNEERARSMTDGLDVPLHVAEILDQSAEDLCQGRVDDARATLARLRRKLNERVAEKSAAAKARMEG